MAASPPPEWTPPPGIRDPYVSRLQPNRDNSDRDKWRARWVTWIRGRLPGPTEHAVAQTLAGYGNKDGSSNRPGVPRLAAALSCSPDTVKRALGWLDEHGWITRTNRDETGRGHAAEYQLTLPAPVAAALGRWDVEYPQWLERPHDAPRRTALKGVHPRTPSRRKGVHADEKGVQTGPVKGCTGAPPPGKNNQGTPSPLRELRSRPHASAAQSQPKIKIRALLDGLDPDDPEIGEHLEQRLDDHGIELHDPVTFHSMINSGQDPARVLAVTLNRQETR